MTQHYENHKRFDPLYHFITLPLTLLCILATAYNLFSCFLSTNLWLNLFLFIGFLLLGFIVTLTRTYALKNQDRAISNTENLRYFAATGKLLPVELRFSQIAALRFASDEEFVALVARAVKGQESAQEIKKSIKKWKADYKRI